MTEGSRLRRCGLCITLLLLATAVRGSETGGEREPEPEQALKQLRGRIGELRSDLDVARDQRQDLEQELREVETRIGAIARRQRELERELGEQQRQLRGLEQDRVGQQRELAEQRQALIAQIRAAYAMGRQDRLKIMLNQQDPAVVSRVMVYYDYFHRARSDKLERIAALIAQIEQTAARTSAGQARLQELQARELEQKQQLEQASAGRQQVLKGLQQEIRDKGQELAGLQRDEQRLQELMARLQREAEQREAAEREAERRAAEQRAAEQRTAEQHERERRQARQPEPAEPPSRDPFGKRKGALTWPVAGRLAAGFGEERGGGLRWDGVFIAAAEGGEVRAVHAGRVVFADWLRGFGLLLIIDHGGGYMSLYGHNRTLLKATGDRVAQGEAVAQVGSSGGQSSAGVYFGIRQQGKPVNPVLWCKAAAGDKVGMRGVPVGSGSEVGSEAARAAESKA